VGIHCGVPLFLVCVWKLFTINIGKNMEADATGALEGEKGNPHF
jgi:hypothetical protein